MSKKFAIVAALLFLVNEARAELIFGRVVDHLGNGVPGVDIDVLNEGSGGDPEVFNDGTDPNGFFSTTVSAFGVFNIEFNAPPPGVITVLSVSVNDVLVVGSVNLGTIVLPPGVALSGRVIDDLGFPVANINLDVIDQATGSRLITPFDRTDLFGNFTIGVPTVPIEVRFDATPVVIPILASKRILLSPTVDLNIGDLQLEPGVIVSGNVRTTGGAPVDGADLDFTDSTSQERAYTPHDNTDEFGNFLVVVPLGTYDVQVCPVAGQLLVSEEIDNVPLLVDASLGIINLEPGFILSGTVTHANGTPAAGIDIDVEISATGSTIALCVDNTNGAGFYSVIVPIGTFNLTFTQRCAGPSVRQERLFNVLVTGNQTQNASLPSGPCSREAGSTPRIFGHSVDAPLF